MPALENALQLSLKNILVTTDFSEFSGRAMSYAVALAHQYAASVLVGHAIVPEPMPPVSVAIPADPVEESERAELGMRQFLKTARVEDLAVKPIYARGHFESVFANMVQENDIDLVVVATHGRHGLKKFLFGSTAEEIYRTTSCPVLTIGPNVQPGVFTRQPWQNVLWATDLSPRSAKTLEYAVALAQDHGAKLTAIHVIEDVYSVPMDYREQALIEARRKLEAMLPPKGTLPFEPEVILRTGEVANAIAAAARENGADLIVMGARKQSSPWTAAHLPWAVAHQTICLAECPVFNVSFE